MKMKKIVERENLLYEINKYVHNFQQYERITSIAKNILGGKITLDDTDKDQSDLLNELVDFQKEAKPRNKKKRKLK